MDLLLLNIISLFSSIDREALKQSLEIFWKGMAAIVIVIGIIFCIVLIINKVSADQHKKKQQQSKDTDNPSENS